MLIYLAALAAVSERARRRGVRVGYVIVPALALLVGSAAFHSSTTAAGTLAVAAPWLWIVFTAVAVSFAHRNKKIDGTWQCPDCTLFNDERTLICLCGHAHPDAPERAKRIDVERRQGPAFDAWPERIETLYVRVSFAVMVVLLVIAVPLLIGMLGSRF